MSSQTLLLIHVLISVVGLASGVVVVLAMFGARYSGLWTATFLVSTALTTVTGFLFPFNGLTPAFVTGVISTPLLVVAFFALYRFRLAGGWRRLYVVTALAALYLNFVALVAQGFLKVPALRALAPTGSEPPFLIAQSALLIAFVIIGVVATRRFSLAPVVA